MSKRIRRWLSVLLALALIMAMVPQNASAKEIKVKNSVGKTKNMAVGSTFQIKTNLSASSLKFTSSKKSVATVSSKGLITAKKKGKATITIRSGKKKLKLKIIIKKPMGYTISRKAGTYNGTVTTTVKVKKGYTVYYAVSDKFTKTNRIKAKSSKTFVFTSTETLKLYPVKGKKMTTAKLRKTEKKSKLRADYLYTIKEKETEEETDTSASPDVTNSPSTETTAEPSVTSSPDASGTPNTSNTPSPDASGTPNIPLPGVPEGPGGPGSSNMPPDRPGSSDAPPSDVQPSSSPTAPGESQYGGDDSMEAYVETTVAKYDETDKDIEIPEDVVEITLPAEAPEKKIAEDTYEISKKNKLTITAPGTYLLHTETIEEAVDGLIEVDYRQDENGETLTGTVHIILDGINLTSSKNTEPDSDTGLITIKKSTTRAVITVKGDSVNTLLDTGNTGIDKDDGVSTTYTGGIICKKTPLTINGSGTLNIYSKNGNGIKATDTLKIRNAKINVSGVEDGSAAGHNGITGKTELYVYQAGLNIHSDGDALKTTLDEDDVADDETLADLGNMVIDGGTYQIISDNGDGISVFRTLLLNPSEIDVTTKNLAASTEDNSYKGIKAGVTIYIPDTAGIIKIDTTATYSKLREKQDSNDPYADDALHCDGCICINGGTFTLAAGDDAIHSDTGLQINGGTIQIMESYEGLESGDMTINNGMIDVKARDDGLNAAGGNNASEGNNAFGGDRFSKGETSSQTNYQIIINGGTLTVDADGDGIDSNGNIFFRGGIVTVNGPEDGGNGALDYGDNNCVCEVSGGTLIAAGAVGMDDAPTSGSSQPVVNIRFGTVLSAGTYVVLKDSDGNVVISAQPMKKFQSIILSCEALKQGETYTVCYGTSLDALTQYTEFTFTSVSVSAGTGGSSGNIPGGGWNPGGAGPR